MRSFRLPLGEKSGTAPIFTAVKSCIAISLFVAFMTRIIFVWAGRLEIFSLACCGFSAVMTVSGLKPQLSVNTPIH